MSNLLPLIQNETIKILKKKRLYVVLLILILLIPVFTYAHVKNIQAQQDKYGQDWHLELQQRITDTQNTLSSNYLSKEVRKYRLVILQQWKYYVDYNINPDEPSGVTFSRIFMDNAVSLLIPLLVVAIASDMVSAERSTGTMKMLLTRPVRRWKILLSKWMVLMMFTAIIVMAAALFSYSISGTAFGFGGWTVPIFTGFSLLGTKVQFDHVHTVPSWMYALMQNGLIWFSSVVVAAISFMISVLMRSTAASFVTIMSIFIAGHILYTMVSSWPTIKYLFLINLRLNDYLSGVPAPMEGMNLLFSVGVLTVWGMVGLFVAFRVFTKQDIVN